MTLQNPNCGSDLKSKLYRTLGELYHAKEQSAVSLRFLADDVRTSTPLMLCGVVGRFNEPSLQCLVLKLSVAWNFCFEIIVTPPALVGLQATETLF